MTTRPELGRQLLEIRKKLSILGCKESSFINVELLFYESLSIARTYDKDPASNELLTALKHLESTLYKNTRELFYKTNQKEIAIRRFMVQLKIVLAVAAKRFLAKMEKSQTT